jgi:hypothetical protein
MRTRTVVLSVLTPLVVLGVVGAWWFTGRETPGEVDIARAVADAAAVAPEANAEQGAAVTEAVTDASGAWTVVTDLVAFDSATGAGTWVGYRIDEELSGVGAFTAVGRSPRVDGEVVIDGDKVVAAVVRADLAGLVSDNANRDGRVRPLFVDRPVVFTLAEPIVFGSIPEAGQRVAVTARGLLRIGDIEREVEVELSADVVGALLVVTGSTSVILADFDVRVPSAPVVLGVSDEATVELQLYLARS